MSVQISNLREVANFGYLLEEVGGQITAVYGSSHPEAPCIRLHQFVTANGRIFVPRGTRGCVVKIDEPDQKGLTCDIFRVVWDHPHLWGRVIQTKFKDLILS